MIKKSRKSTPLFPMTAIIIIACVGIFCGCGIICHNFRRHALDLELNTEHMRRCPRIMNNNVGPNRQNRTLRNDNSVMEPIPRLLRTESQSSSSKYDSILFDDPPPKYEDAIKEYPTEIIIQSPQFNSQNANNNDINPNMQLSPSGLST